jgi:hypothetical protein
LIFGDILLSQDRFPINRFAIDMQTQAVVFVLGSWRLTVMGDTPEAVSHRTIQLGWRPPF